MDQSFFAPKHKKRKRKYYARPWIAQRKASQIRCHLFILAIVTALTIQHPHKVAAFQDKFPLFLKRSNRNVIFTSKFMSESERIPRHVAFICDGNSRWAKRRGLPSVAGHVAGADRVIEVLQKLKDTGVTVCTLFGFSTENWKRSDAEVKAILSVMERSTKEFYDRALLENVKVQLLGDIDDPRLPSSLTTLLRKLEHDTSHQNEKDSTFTVCLAINYGGRQDIIQACKQMMKYALESDAQENQIESIDQQLFESCLSTSGIPDPDLIVRTSGECRLSNFLLWNAAYAELYFTDTLWPDFDGQALQDALDWYANRARRFGGRTVSHS